MSTELDTLKEIIYEIRSDDVSYSSIDTKYENYCLKYPVISDRYTMILKKACEPDFDIDKLLWMIDMKTQVDNN